MEVHVDEQAFPSPGQRWHRVIALWVDGYRGVPLSAALQEHFHALDDPESEAMFASGPKVTYKVQVHLLTTSHVASRV